MKDYLVHKLQNKKILFQIVKIIYRLLYIEPIALYAVYRLKQQSAQERILLDRRPKHYWNLPYQNQPILLIAIYQNGTLRNDIVNLFKSCKRNGIYITCINTSSLQAPSSYNDLIDCYIERPNYGRDFGSYKLGFNYIYNNNIHKTCPKLAIANDSVFYSKKNLDTFLSNIYSSSSDVMGATENLDVQYHIGSFFVLFSNFIIKHHTFIEFWKNYKETNYRRDIILKGEMALTNVAQRCVTDKSSVSAMFNSTWFDNYLIQNPACIAQLPTLNRQNLIIKAWPSIPENIPPEEEYTDFNNINEISRLSIKFFEYGSQIHQNALILHAYGLPMIKLDGLYRGFFSERDLDILTSQLEAEEQAEFNSIIRSRPYGGKTLHGWKKIAFLKWVI